MSYVVVNNGTPVVANAQLAVPIVAQNGSNGNSPRPPSKAIRSDSKWQQCIRRAAVLTGVLDVLFSIVVLVWAVAKHYRKNKSSITISLSVLDVVALLLLVFMLLKGIYASKSRWIFPYLLLSVTNVLFWIVFTVLFFINKSHVRENGLGVWWIAVVCLALYWMFRVLMQFALLHTYTYIKDYEKDTQGTLI